MFLLTWSLLTISISINDSSSENALKINIFSISAKNQGLIIKNRSIYLFFSSSKSFICLFIYLSISSLMYLFQMLFIYVSFHYFISCKDVTVIRSCFINFFIFSIIFLILCTVKR